MLDQTKFRIFISHKHADAELASTVRRILEGLDPRRSVEAWVSGEDLVVGGDWNRAIKERLATSHLLVLLHTRPSYEWDWCLYETGLFTRFEQRNVSGVVCIYDKDGEPPRPLSNLQGIRSEAGAVEHCLRQLFRQTWQVSDDWKRGNLDPAADLDDGDERGFAPGDDEIAQAAAEIAAAFDEALVDEDGPTPPGERPTHGDDVYYPCHRVVLDFGEFRPVLYRIVRTGLDRVPVGATIMLEPVR